MRKILGFIFTLLFAVALPGAGFAANFGAGNVVVLRSGNTGSSNTAAAYLDEFTPAGGSPVQTISLPVTLSGSSTAEGALRLSADGRFLTLGGYNGTTGVALTGLPRVVARVDATGAVDSSTTVTGLSATNIRGAVTNDGSAFWVVGAAAGAQYVTFGQSTASTQINSASPVNLRVPGIYNGQFYVSTASTFYGVGTIGSGLPTTGLVAPAVLNGFPTSSGPSSYGFFFADANTLYVADDRAINTATPTLGGGIQKWTFDGTKWSLVKTMIAGTGTTGFRGVTGYLSGGNVVIYATSTESSANKLMTLTDPLSDITNTPTFTTLATAPASNAFRGVDFAPASPVNGACGSDNGQTLAATAPANLCSAGTASTVGGSGHPWTWSCYGQNGGSTANNCTATIQTYTLTFTTDGNGTLTGTSLQTIDYGGASTAVTANPNGGYSFLNWTGTNGFATSYANPVTVTKVTASQTITANFSATPVDGACGSDNGQTLAAAAPTNLCSTGAFSQVSGSGHPWSWTCAGANGGSTANCSAAIQTYTISFATGGNGTLSGSTTQTVDYGGTTTAVTADPNSDFSFVNWTGTNGFTATSINPLVIGNVTASRTVTANFSGNIIIFHVNDTHARVTPHKWIVTEHGTDVPAFEDVGGAAYLASEMLQLTAVRPNALVIDAGDISEGNPIGDMNGNGTMTQFYTLLSGKLKKQRGRGIDAVVVGNHDVRDANYIGNLVALQNSGVPVISVNVRDANTHQPYFAPYTIVTIGNTRVGILGYTTSASEVGASLANTLEVVTCDWHSTDVTKVHLADYVNDLRNNQGVNVVVLAAHIGHSGIVDPTAPLLVDDGYAKLPEAAITGHWHTWAETVWQPEMLNYKTIFAESASYMKYIGELDLTSAGNYVSSAQHVIRDADLTPDPDVQTLIDNLTTQYNTAHPGHPVDEVIGYTGDDLMLDNTMKWWSADEYPWSGNNSAGQWICDAMRWKAEQLFGQCDLSMEAGGGVRADIPAGPVTYMQIYETFPWNDDTFTRVNMTGQEIVNFLKATTMDAGFSSALDVTAFDGIPTSVLFNGQSIDLAHTYTVAINNYMYNHPPAGFTWSDTAPLNSNVLCRDGIVDFMRQFTSGSPYHVGGDRYHLNTEFSGGYRAVVTMMNDNDTKTNYEYAFVRLLSATPETLARRGNHQVPTDLVNADGTINAANRLSEQELYRSYLGFKTGALKQGDIIETWGKGAFYGGNPEFVDQEGIYADGVEFRIVGHDDSLAKPAFVSSIGAFWNDNYKNHYVQFLAKKTGASTVADQYGQTVTVMDVTGYVAKTLPGNVGDTLLISGVPTMESYALHFRCDNAATTTVQLPSVTAVTSHINPVPTGTSGSSLTLSATTTINSGTYFLAPVADAQIASGKPTTNYNTTNLYIQTSSVNSYGNERAWLKFDLSGIPTGATITGANLQLWDWKATGAALPTEVRGSSDDSWTETGITWNTQPTFGDAPLDTQTLAAATANLWYTWNVTSFAQGKWAGNKLVSLVVKPAAEGSTDATAPSYGFDSKEYGSNAPVLQVTTQSNGGTSVAQVQFFYRYSPDNATWGLWTPISTATGAPYTTAFSYPQGTGYYEFYSQATDSNSNVEPAPAAAQTATHYTATPAFYPIVSLTEVYQKYDGSTKQVAVTTIPDGTPVTVTYNGDTTVPVTAGTYTVEAASGGTVMANGTFTIAKATATVSIGKLSFSYDGTPKNVTVTTTPADLPVTLTYNGSTTAPSVAGTYSVAAVVNDTNYQGGTIGTMTITGPIDITSQVRPATAGYVYSRATQKFTGTLTVTNIGQATIAGPFAVLMNNLATGATLTNASGTYNGFPYIASASQSLAPGQSFSVTLQFSNPLNKPVNFTPVIYQSNGYLP